MILHKRGTDLAIRVLLDEKLYFLQFYERWFENFEIMRDHVFTAVPLPQRIGVGEHDKDQMAKKLDLQGVGGFTDSKKRAAVQEIWEGLAGLLEAAKKNVGQGETFYVTVFGFAISVMVCKSGPRSTELVRREFPIVIYYANRIWKKWFGCYSSPFEGSGSA